MLVIENAKFPLPTQELACLQYLGTSGCRVIVFILRNQTD